MTLALSTLIYEWRRYLAAIIALAFSGLLVLAQTGMFMGIGAAFSATIERSPADVMVLAPKATSLFGGNSGVPRRLMPVVYKHPEVVEVADMDTGWGRWQNVSETAQPDAPKDDAKAKATNVMISAVDPHPGSVTLPTDYSDSVRDALLEPYAIAIDRTALKRLGVKQGDKATINGQVVRVKAVLDGYPNMMEATVVSSRDTLRLLGQASTGDRVGPLMVRVADPLRAEQVRDELNAMSQGKYRAWTRAELAKANQNAMFEEQIIGIMLGFSVFLGVLIGVGITSQTLRGAILASIKEFASLRALGVSMGSLRRIVIELSFWVGIAGLLATALLTAGVGSLAAANGVPMSFPPEMVAGVGVLLVFIAVASGLLALGILKKSQPADLLR
ncbi:MAG: ABC transporter permease [Proteobacteria bacterium]|nr:ABC transporter permease [Pseudomonadota bacterium]